MCYNAKEVLKMILDDVRKMAKEKKDAILQDPNSTQHDKEYVDKVIKIFSNEDYIKEASRGLVEVLLFYLGVEFGECEQMYNDLMKEINTTYDVVFI